MSKCCKSYRDTGEFCDDCPKLEGLSKKERKKRKKKLLKRK